MLEIRLLGRFEVLIDGQPLELPSRPSQALLAYLALHPGVSHRREQLAGLLWPDSEETNARRYLSQALWRLRKSLGERYFQADKLSLAFNPRQDDLLDVRLLSQQPPDDPQAWMEALAVYRGRLLPGFYDDWAWEQAEHFQSLFERQAQSLLDFLVTEQKWREVLEWGERWLRLGETAEPAYRALMQAHAGLGDQAGVAAVYRRCVAALARDLGVEPSLETRALFEQIQTGEWNARAARTTTASKPERKTHVIPHSPYRGLFAFRQEDAPFYFGRELFTQRLVDAVKRQPIVAVVGPSGSGKSSVVFAGLLARLHTEARWLPAAFRPGDQPFTALAGALAQLLEPEMTETERLVEIRNLAQALSQGELALYDVIERILDKQAGKKRLLLVIDQFEELYTLVPETDGRRSFLDALLRMVQVEQFRPAPTVTLVLTLRADFFGQVLGYRPLADALQKADIKLGPMTRQEMARAISVPAQRQGVGFEGGLVERILDDVAEEPGNLPLLEFTLTALWGELEAPTITHAAYDAIGRVEGSLARYADEVYGSLNPDERQAAHRVFVQMVRPGEGTEDTRRLATKTELGADGWVLVQQLADARLVVTGKDAAGQETVEVVHEALIRGWGQLQGWMAEDRKFRLWQERLRGALRQWQGSERDEGALMRGVPLAEAEGWLSERGADLSQQENEYIQGSIALRNRREAERERRRQEREGMLAARVRLQRRVNVGLAIGIAIALVLTIFAGWQWRDAVAERERANAQTELALQRFSNQLAARAQALLDEQLELALLLSVEAYQAADTVESRSSLEIALSHNPQFIASLRGDSPVRSIDFSPDGRFLASGNEDGSLLLWEVAGGDADYFRPVSRLTAGDIESLVFSPDGRWLASAGDDRTVLLWDLDTMIGSPEPSPRQILSGHASRILSLDFNPDGKILASGDFLGNILLWDLDRDSPGFGNQIGFLAGDSDEQIYSLAFSPDGRTLASGTCGERSTGTCPIGEIRFWDVTNQQIERVLKGHPGWVVSLAYSPDGNQLVSSGFGDSEIIIWDLDAESENFGQAVDTLEIQNSFVREVAFSPTGERATAAIGDGSLVLWSALDGISENSLLEVGQSSLTDVAFSPDGNLLATSSEDGSIALWRISQDHPLAQRLNRPDGRLPDLEWFAWTNERLALAAEFGNIFLWDLNQRDPVGKFLSGHRFHLAELFFSPNGAALISGGADGRYILWDAASGEQLNVLENQIDTVKTICQVPVGITTNDFSPDGRLFASAGTNGSITILDTDTGQPVGPPLQGHRGRVSSIAFHPDNQFLASVDSAGEIRLWNIEKDHQSFGQTIEHGIPAQTRQIDLLIFSQDGSKLIAGGRDEMSVWDLSGANGDGGQQAGISIPRCLGLHLDSWWFESPFPTYLAYQDDGTFQLWELETVEPYGQLNQHPVAFIYHFAYDANSNIIATGGADGSIAIWDEVTGEPLFPFYEGNSGDVWQMIFSSDGNKLATSYADGSIVVLDTNNGNAAVPVLKGHNRAPWDMAFSTSGEILASGGGNDDGQIILWDLASGLPIGQPLSGHEYVQSLFYLENEDVLVSLSTDGNAFFWDLDIESWLARACRRANRNLTPSEWRQFFGEEPYRATCPGLPAPQE